MNLKRILGCPVLAIGLTITATAQVPKYKYSSWTGGAGFAAGSFHLPGTQKGQEIYYPTDFPTMPAGAVTAIYLRIGFTYGATTTTNPTLYPDFKLKMGYTADSAFMKTGVQYPFVPDLPLMVSKSTYSVSGTDSVGRWIRIPLELGNFFFSKSRMFVVEISHGWQATNNGFDWMASNVVSKGRSLGGYWDSSGSPGPPGKFIMDLGMEAYSTAVGGYSALKGFYAYPNPSNGLFTVGFEPGKVSGQPASILVTDVMGREVWRHSYEVAGGADLFAENVDLRGRPAGMYLLSVQSGGQLVTHKVQVE